MLEIKYKTHLAAAFSFAISDGTLFLWLFACGTDGVAQFKEISFAYEVLSNPDKRRTYDRYGEEGLREGASGG